MTAPAATETNLQAIYAELEETRAGFHALLADIPDEALEQPTGNYPDVGGGLPGGERTIAMMYGYLKQHFEEHLPEFDPYRTGKGNERN